MNKTRFSNLLANWLADFVIALGVTLPVAGGLLLWHTYPWVAALAFAAAYPAARVILRQLSP